MGKYSNANKKLSNIPAILISKDVPTPTEKGWYTEHTKVYTVPYIAIGDAIARACDVDLDIYGYCLEWTGSGLICAFVPKDPSLRKAEIEWNRNMKDVTGEKKCKN